MSIRPFCCIYAVLLLLLLLWDAVKAEKETKKVKKGNQGEATSDQISLHVIKVASLKIGTKCPAQHIVPHIG